MENLVTLSNCRVISTLLPVSAIAISIMLYSWGVRDPSNLPISDLHRRLCEKDHRACAWRYEREGSTTQSYAIPCNRCNFDKIIVDCCFERTVVSRYRIIRQKFRERTVQLCNNTNSNLSVHATRILRCHLTRGEIARMSLSQEQGSGNQSACARDTTWSALRFASVRARRANRSGALSLVLRRERRDVEAASWRRCYFNRRYVQLRWAGPDSTTNHHVTSDRFGSARLGSTSRLHSRLTSRLTITLTIRVPRATSLVIRSRWSINQS